MVNNPLAKHVIKRKPNETIWEDTEVYGGVLDDVADLMQEKVSLAFGRNRMEKNWKTGELPLGQMVHDFCNHTVAKNKDGKCVTQGALVSKRRLANNISSLDLLILDMDTGQPISEVRERILEENLFAIIYTTHSYGSTTSEVMETKLMKSMEVSREDVGAGDKNTDQIVRSYFSIFMKYHKSIIDGMRYTKTELVDGGIKVFVEHPPMQKYRLVFLLDQPYSFTDPNNGKDQRAAIIKWKSKYAGVAELLNASFDTACTDPSRLFYLPTHKKGAEYHTEIVVGNPINFADIKAGNPRGHSVDNSYLEAAEEDGDHLIRSEIKWLTAWASKSVKKFQAADFYRDYGAEELRVKSSGNVASGMCPSDERHSDPGNSDDAGFYSFNADPDNPEENKRVGKMGCTHNGCKAYGTTTFIEALMEIGILPDREKEVLDILNEYVTEYIETASEQEDTQADSEAPDETATEEPERERTKKKTTKKSSKKADKKVVDDTPVKIPDITEFPIAVQRILKKIAKVQKWDDDAVDNIINRLVDDEINYGVAKVVLNYLSDVTGFGKVDLKKQYDSTIKMSRKQNKRDTMEEDGDKRLMVNLRGSFEEVVDKTLKGLRVSSRNDPKVFIMDGVGLSRVATSIETGNVFREIVGREALFTELTNSVFYYEDGPNGSIVNKAASPDIITYIRGLPLEDIPVPLLSSIVNHPIFSIDGKLHTKNGYDKRTACYLQTSFKPLPVPNDPTEDDLNAAYDLIFDEMYVDFPLIDRRENKRYDDPGQASKANLLAMLLQPFVRNIIGNNPTPLFVLDKSLAGAGATKIADSLSLIMDGESSSKYNILHSEEENEKKLMSKLKSTPDGMMFFDNIGKKVVSSVLAAALTSDNYTGRILGQTKDVTTKVKHVWIISGSNLSFSNEIARRCIPITILPSEDKPYLRTGFKHEHFEGWVLENRAELTQALCVIAQNWVADGMPNWKPPKDSKAIILGSYVEWSNILGGILQSFGMDGFLENLTDMHEDSSEDASGYAMLLTECLNITGGFDIPFQTKSIHDALWDGDGREYENLDGLGINTNQGVGEAKKSLARQFSSIKDRPVVVEYKDEEYRVRLVKDGITHGAVRWKIVNI